MKTLYLIDGHAQFFRAFHAIRTPMSSPVTREPTNATFGFVGMLLKVLRELKPEFLAVAIDVSGDRETFRSELYPEYKATRQAPPETLGPQIERCIALLREIGVPTIGVPGVEADDVIATIVERCAGRPIDGEPLLVRLVSKDKDLQQLLRRGEVEMYDVHTEELMDVDRLLRDKGVAPEGVIDMLALMGDTVDNVPGVEGIGPKTAAELIARYGSIDNLLEHAAEIKGKRGESLRAARETLALSRTLVTLKRDVEFDFDLDAARVNGLKLDRLEPLLRELGFNRYRDELAQLLGGPAKATGEGSKQTAVEAGRAAGSAAGVPEAPKAPRARVRASAAEAPRFSVDSHGFGGSLFEQPAGDAPGGPALAQEDWSDVHAAGTYTCVRTRDALEAIVRRAAHAPVIAIDTETTGLSPLRCDLCGISLALQEGEAFYIPVRSPDPASHMSLAEVMSILGPLLEDASRPKCGHNLKYDMLVLRRHGVELRGGVGTLFDSMVASYLIDSSRSSHSLDNLCLGILGHTNIPISRLIGSGKQQRTFDTVDLWLATVYAAEDADMSLRLHNVFLPQLRAMGLIDLFARVEMPLVVVLAELEWNGIIVDSQELDRQAARLNLRIDELRRLLAAASPVPFNPDSPKQLSQVLFNSPSDAEPGLGIKPLKKTKTGYSTDVEVLEKLASDPEVTSPVPGLIVEYRQLTKLVGTYLVALKEEINPATGRIHASFNQTVAATGRLSSSDPNLQNIPIRTEVGREIRRAFVAAPGHVLISADYSQIELRLLAHLSRDEALISAFHRGEDIHTAVAAQIHAVPPGQVTKEQRNGAKMVNFGIVYGITAFGLARRLGVDNAAAAEIIDGYKRRFPGITTFLDECVTQAKRAGYVETILKRRRPVPGIESRNPNERALAERIAINSVVQGSAADLIKLAMVDLHARLAPDSPEGKDELEGVKMLLQIHDELVFECPRDHAGRAREVIIDRMERAMDLLVPLKVDASVGADWFEDS